VPWSAYLSLSNEFNCGYEGNQFRQLISSCIKPDDRASRRKMLAALQFKAERQGGPKDSRMMDDDQKQILTISPWTVEVSKVESLVESVRKLPVNQPTLRCQRQLLYKWGLQ
jgi:hypothetical protein